MEFDLAADGTLTPLPQQNIDTGLGLERGAMLLQDVGSIFDTDGYQAIMRWVAEESGVAYGDSEQATKAHRVLADHGRAMVFLISEGITPSNEGRGYIVRRLIRRAVQQGNRIGLTDVYRLPAIVIEQVAGAFPELLEHAAEIERVVKAEEERFGETLERGLKVFDDLAGQDAISGEDAFTLAATYGFPLELTIELAEERGQPVDVDDYRVRMAEHRTISRAGGESDTQRAADFAARRPIRRRSSATTRPTCSPSSTRTRISATARSSPSCASRRSTRPAAARSPIRGSSSSTAIRRRGPSSCRRTGSATTRCSSSAAPASPPGSRVRAVVPWSVRFPTMANHTATHLLQEALREVLGEHVKQAGSAVRPDKLRFDFTHGQQLSAEERERIEQRVNRAIFENHPLHVFETPIDEARKLGAMMLFGEKYGDIVRVVEIEGVSRELCGGTHVRSTAEIGSFAILSEGSVGSGARRIEAVTSGEAWALLHGRSRELDAVRAELEEARKELKRKPAQGGGGGEVEAVVRAENGFNLIVQAVEGLDGDALLDLSDRFKQRHSPAAVVLGGVEDGKVTLIANFDDTVAERVSASDVVKGAAALVGGGGGGRRTMARAGGKDPERLPEALAEAERLILACGIVDDARVSRSTTAPPAPASPSPTRAARSRARSASSGRRPPRPVSPRSPASSRSTRRSASSSGCR